MTHFRANFRKLVGLSLWLVVLITSPVVYGQSADAAPPSNEGWSSYIFSPYAVTVLLVLVLVAQLVYRHRNKNRVEPVMKVHKANPQAAAKKRYDRAEISKVLKASASSKNTGRSLEEAIRMSQVAHDDLIGILDAQQEEDENIAPVDEPEAQTVEAQPQSAGAENPVDTRAAE